MALHKKLIWVLMVAGFILVGAGCIGESSARASDKASLKPTVPTLGNVPTLASFGKNPALPPRFLAQNCIYPAGWQAYTVVEGETADVIAWKFNISRDQLLQSNCLFDPASLVPGLVIYVPPSSTNLQTILPLGVSLFTVAPQTAAAGSSITLSWVSQGNVHRVRVGSVFNGQYVEAANGLPSTGSLELTAPADGRDIITYVVLVSDGLQEVMAQTNLQIQCPDGWFFAPSPAGCPSALLLTTFQEQAFERGTIVYIPTLGTLYVMIVGQEAVEIDDSYVPGMPDYDPAIPTPPGLTQPKGAIFHLWRNDTIRNALGYALHDAVNYQGMMQRTVSTSGEVVYMLASSGHIYRFGRGLVWGVIIPE